MSLRTAARSIALAAAGAAVAASVAALLSPSVRRAALGLVGKAGQPEAEAQPTHIVLPDREPAASWGELDDSGDGGIVVPGDVALTGS